MTHATSRRYSQSVYRRLIGHLLSRHPPIQSAKAAIAHHGVIISFGTIIPSTNTNKYTKTATKDTPTNEIESQAKRIRHYPNMKMTRNNLACLIGVSTLACKRAAMGLLPATTHLPTRPASVALRAMHQHNFSVTNRIRSPPQRREFSVLNSSSQDPTYATRQSNFGMANKDVLAETAKLDDVVFVDARGLDEIAEASLDIPFVHGNFILKQELGHLHQILPNKKAHIIVFCKAGGRAQKVKQTLEANGYVNVLNAGGLGDIDFLP